MSSSALAPAAADPLALFQLRCAHRRRARSLSGSLRAFLNAEFDRLQNQGDFTALLNRLHIPDRAARRLAFPSQTRNTPPVSACDAAFRDQTLTIRLRPNHRAILELCADAIQRDSARPHYDFGAIAVSWLRCNTRGLARQELDAFLQLCSNGTLPGHFTSLPPVFVPSSPGNARPRGARSQRTVPYPSPPENPSLWPELCASRRAQRLLSRQLRPHWADLADQIDRMHRQLAHSGRSGAFHAWLKAHDIPRRSAYRLLKIKGLNCAKRDSRQLEGALTAGGRPVPACACGWQPEGGSSKRCPCDPAPGPDLELRAHSAAFRLSRLDSALAHRILQDTLQALDPNARPRDFSAEVAAAFIEQLAPGPARLDALDWFNHTGPGFPLPRLFQSNPRYFNRESHSLAASRLLGRGEMQAALPSTTQVRR
ncbi:MAG: hypothetical protein ACRD04_02570 [Terriglobales bacterium]